MKQTSLEKQVQDLCEPIAQSLGLELVQVQYRRESRGWILRILIDRTAGVTVNDCQECSRELSHLLDIEDPIPNSYQLEVSSPGLNRPLTKLQDFDRFSGRIATITLHAPIHGRKIYQGKLVGAKEDEVLLEVDGKKVSFHLDLVEKANLVPFVVVPNQ